MKMQKIFLILCFVFLLFSCKKVPVMTLEQIEESKNLSSEQIISKTVSKFWNGSDYVPGKIGGTWNSVLNADPKTFNHLIAERDGTSSSIIQMTTDSIAEYDTFSKSWIPQACFFEIEINEEMQTLTVHCTIRDGLFWSYCNSDEKIPVTSDDIVWWYDNISGNPEFQSSAYSGQFVTMPDGSVERIRAVKIDDRHFDFVYPRIVADPVLSSNCSFYPSWIYKEAFEKNGTEGVKNLFSINTDPRTIPSMGRYYISEYSPGQRLVFSRNPNYWQKDENGISNPYPEQTVYQIVGDQNTSYLLFKQGNLETYSPNPENLSDIINAQNSDYTVFNSEASIGALMWSFNQNPKNKNEAYYEWFTKKEFRQAMSCLLNRERIVNQTFRGLASPKYDFFPDANPFYNKDIQLKYKYDRQKAVELLSAAGITQDKDKIMRDWKNRPVEFDLVIASSSTTTNDMAQIIFDECKAVGITVNVRQTDFQKMVEQLTATYDWQSVIIGLGSNFFPTQGSNVWPSSGNLHLWNPLQRQPATDWEARIDYLYNEGSYTIDKEKSKQIWDEYQTILLEQCPVIYLVTDRGFLAINNRWDFSNFYFDNKNGAMTTRVFLRDK